MCVWVWSVCIWWFAWVIYIWTKFNCLFKSNLIYHTWVLTCAYVCVCVCVCVQKWRSFFLFCLIYLYFQHTRLLYLLPPTLYNWNVFHILVAFWLYYFFNNQHHNLKSINFYLNRWICTLCLSMHSFNLIQLLKTKSCLYGILIQKISSKLYNYTIMT